MSNVHELMPGFHAEIVKEAFPMAGLGRRILQSGRLGGGAAGAGAGAVVGAGAGGAIEGTRAYREARNAGAGGGQSAMHALGRGIGGAAKGALLGAGVGAGAGVLKPSAASGLAARQTGSLGAGARFGQRQLHGLTGWTPKGGIESIRGGAWEAKKRTEGIRSSLQKAAPDARGKLNKSLVKAERGQQWAQKAQDMGLTNIPGYAKSLVKNGPGKTISTGVKEQWHGSGPAGKALIFGFPAVTIGGELARPSKPGEAGRLERAGRNVGDLAYSMGPMPIASQMAAATALSAAGGQTGKLLRKKKQQRANKHIPAPPQLDPAGGDAVAGESIVTDRAMGGGGQQ